MATYSPSNLSSILNQVTAYKPASEWSYDPHNPYVGTNIKLADGQIVPYDAVVQQVLKRYEENQKNPTLAVKSGVQLGIPDEVLRTLPGVDDAALNAGHQLIDSGAFVQNAVNEDTNPGAMYGQEIAPINSDMYNARIAAGLDAYGLPPQQVAALRAAGQYVEPNAPAAQAGDMQSYTLADGSNIQIPAISPTSANTALQYSPEQIQNAIADSRAQGFSDEQIMQGAKANFGTDVSSYLTPQNTSALPTATSSVETPQAPTSSMDTAGALPIFDTSAREAKINDLNQYAPNYFNDRNSYLSEQPV
jgi:hypothetical protein